MKDFLKKMSTMLLKNATYGIIAFLLFCLGLLLLNEALDWVERVFF